MASFGTHAVNPLSLQSLPGLTNRANHYTLLFPEGMSLQKPVISFNDLYWLFPCDSVSDTQLAHCTCSRKMHVTLLGPVRQPLCNPYIHNICLGSLQYSEIFWASEAPVTSITAASEHSKISLWYRSTINCILWQRHWVRREFYKLLSGPWNSS